MSITLPPASSRNYDPTKSTWQLKTERFKKKHNPLSRYRLFYTAIAKRTLRTGNERPHTVQNQWWPRSSRCTRCRVRLCICLSPMFFLSNKFFQVMWMKLNQMLRRRFAFPIPTNENISLDRIKSPITSWQSYPITSDKINRGSASRSLGTIYFTY